jgi:hypothetical protein
MADPNVPWSIKGISTEARAAAREVAKKSGMPLGAWLARCIREVAAAEASERSETEAVPPKP